MSNPSTLRDWSVLSTYATLVPMKQVAAAKFKEQCLALLDRLDPDGIVITKHGKPVARLLPAERAAGGLIGSLRGAIHIRGDVLTTGSKWRPHA